MPFQHVHPPFWRRHRAASVLVLGMTTWWLWNGWYDALAVAVVAVVVVAAVSLVALRRHRCAVAVRDAGLRARADYEHRLSLAGDPRGVFGRYPPVQAGWYRDPFVGFRRQNRCGLRYFDGAAWTPHHVAR